MSFYQFQRTQKIPQNIDKVWEFISNPENLKKITPPEMGFEINSEFSGNSMYEGMIISYRVSPLFNIRTVWVTEITHVVPKKYFVDEQRVGPYKMWHHEHHLTTINNGVLMTDLISYQPPLGWLGKIANAIIIQKKLNAIFNYRTAALEKQFGKWDENE